MTTVSRFLRYQNLEFLSWHFDQNSLRPFQYYAVSWTCAVSNIGVSGVEILLPGGTSQCQGRSSLN